MWSDDKGLARWGLFNSIATLTKLCNMKKVKVRTTWKRSLSKDYVAIDPIISEGVWWTRSSFGSDDQLFRILDSIVGVKGKTVVGDEISIEGLISLAYDVISTSSETCHWLGLYDGYALWGFRYEEFGPTIARQFDDLHHDVCNRYALPEGLGRGT